jgi:hypothetical protein
MRQNSTLEVKHDELNGYNEISATGACVTLSDNGRGGYRIIILAGGTSIELNASDVEITRAYVKS